MIPIWNSRISCTDGGSIVCSLWAVSADFRVSPLSWRSAVLKAPTPFLVSDNISSTLSESSMHGLDKVAHVSHVPDSASVRGLGLSAFPAVDRYPAPGPASVGWAPGSAPSALDGRLSPQLTTISPGSLGDGRRREATLRRRGFDFCRQPLLFGPGFGFCGTTVMVVLARMSESARAGSAAGISEP